MWLYVLVSSICVSTVAFILISVRQPTTPVPSGTLAAIIAVSFLLNLLLTQVRDDLVVAAATRFDFVKLYYYRWIIRVALMCMLVVLFLSSSAFVFPSLFPLVFPSLRPSTVAYLFVGSLVSYLATYPVLLYTDFFSKQGEASLCLQQALDSVDLGDFNRWFRRGVKATIIRLKEIGLCVAGPDIVFAVNIKILRGEPVKDTLERMASDIINLAPPKKEPSRLQPSGLYDIIETLTRLAQSARKDGLYAVPSYHERISRTWDLLTRSAPILGFILAAAIVLYTYFVTGKLPLVFPQ